MFRMLSLSFDVRSRLGPRFSGWATVLSISSPFLACSRVGLESPFSAIRPAAGLPAGAAFWEAALERQGPRTVERGWTVTVGPWSWVTTPAFLTE